MNLDFKRNIMQLGKFLCGIFAVVYFFTFLVMGLQIFVQIGTEGEFYLIASAVFSLLSSALLLSIIILIVLNFTVKKMQKSRTTMLALFCLAVIVSALSFAMLLISLIAVPEISNDVQQILGYGVATSIQTGCILSLVFGAVLAFITLWQSKNECQKMVHNIDDNLENIEIQKDNSNVKKLKKVFYPIIFSFVFLFAVLASLFVAFVYDEGYAAPTYDISLSFSSINRIETEDFPLYDYQLVLGVDCTYKEPITIEIEFTYDISIDSYTKVGSATLQYGENNLEFYLGQYNWDHTNLTDVYYRVSGSSDFIKMPVYSTYIYRFETIEYIFLGLMVASVLGVAISTTIYLVKLGKAKKEELVLESVEKKQGE